MIVKGADGHPGSQKAMIGGRATGGGWGTGASWAVAQAKVHGWPLRNARGQGSRGGCPRLDT